MRTTVEMFPMTLPAPEISADSKTPQCAAIVPAYPAAFAASIIGYVAGEL
jgi:hypothetical protein